MEEDELFRKLLARFWATSEDRDAMLAELEELYQITLDKDNSHIRYAEGGDAGYVRIMIGGYWRIVALLYINFDDNETINYKLVESMSTLKNLWPEFIKEKSAQLLEDLEMIYDAPIEGKDVKLVYPPNSNKGTLIVTIKGQRQRVGTVEVDFTEPCLIYSLE